MYKVFGLSLIELLTTLSIFSILGLAGIPSLQGLLAKSDGRHMTKISQRFATMARYEAITREQEVTLCYLDQNNECSRNDLRNLALFVDSNENRSFDNDEELIFQDDFSYRGTFQLRASLNRSYIQFTPEGSSNQAGSLIYCNPQYPTASRRVTISMSGRAYEGFERDGNGVVLMPNGNPITCS